MRRLIVSSVLTAAAMVACTPAAQRQVDDDVLIALPPPSAPGSGLPAAVIDGDDRIGFVVDGVVGGDHLEWRARPSGDGSTVVMTAGEGAGVTHVAWRSLPDGDLQRTLDIPGFEGEVTAVSLDGEFAAITTRPAEPEQGAIAGSRDGTTIVVVSRADGVVYEAGVDGNVEPEAFGRRQGADGVPAQLFLLEYLPADAPRVYRVRVLSTESGELALPLNLRDKTQTVDQQMAGYTRSQVVSADDGLLFTLYVGTDDMPGGHPHAFVHTLDLDDGVWCLEIDPRLELEHLPGSLAVGGGRVYVASPNGWVGSYSIPSILDAGRSPVMDWVTNVDPGATGAPAIQADESGVTVAYDDQLIRVDSAGELESTRALSGRVSAISAHGHMIGPDWSTLGSLERPDWLGDIALLFTGSGPRDLHN